METEYFIKILELLSELGYDQVRRAAFLYSLSAELKKAEESRKKAIIYVFMNFFQLEERSFLLDAVKTFPQNRLEILETIITMEDTDRFGHNHPEHCKEVIEIARSIEEDRKENFLNLLRLSQCIYVDWNDVFKFVLAAYKELDISKFRDVFRLNDYETDRLERLMNLYKNRAREFYDFKHPYYTLPKKVNLEMNDDGIKAFEQKLHLLRKIEDD